MTEPRRGPCPPDAAETMRTALPAAARAQRRGPVVDVARAAAMGLMRATSMSGGGAMRTAPRRPGVRRTENGPPPPPV
eukprot:9273932-Lingulodinium_polyedra.AAC.1